MFCNNNFDLYRDLYIDNIYETKKGGKKIVEKITQS